MSRYFAFVLALLVLSPNAVAQLTRQDMDEIRMHSCLQSMLRSFPYSVARRQCLRLLGHEGTQPAPTRPTASPRANPTVRPKAAPQPSGKAAQPPQSPPPRSQRLLERLVADGKHQESEGNLRAAFDAYCTAGADGSADALVQMGWMFIKGNGVEQSNIAGATLFKRAAAFGHRTSGELARKYYDGPKELLPVCLRGMAVEIRAR